MSRLRRWGRILMASALFWIFVIVSSMMLFIVTFERPINFSVENQYHITQ